jgi:hypothetical protein
MSQPRMNGSIIEFGGKKMPTKTRKEILVEQRVTYTLFKDGQLYVVENVPARVNPQTGEQFFAPQTLENLQKIVLEHKNPTRTIKAPVFEYV